MSEITDNFFDDMCEIVNNFGSRKPNELKACPHCGSMHVSLEKNEHGRYCVVCDIHTCGARGGFGDDQQDAINVWNMRTLIGERDNRE